MRGNWAKWILLAIVAMVFSTPAWAIEFKLGGEYQIQGRYYSEYDITSTSSGGDPTEATDQYFKHYAWLYPKVILNDKVSINMNLEAFDGVLSKDDTVQWYGVSESDDSKPYDDQNVFTIDELYLDATTPVGKFIIGKTTGMNGIGWFIRLPQLEGWTFGAVLDRTDEDVTGADDTHDNADKTNYGLVQIYANQKIFFNNLIALKHSDREVGKTGIFLDILYLNYQLTDQLKFYSKWAVGSGVLVDKDSKSAQGIVGSVQAGYYSAINSMAAGAAAAAASGAAGAEPQLSGYDTLADYNTAYATWQATYSAVYNPTYAGYYAGGLAAYDDLLSLEGFEDDWGSAVWGAWVGLEYAMDTMTIRGDFAYLPGASEPQELSAYLDDDEDFDTWLMQDIHDRYAAALETPAAIAALKDPMVEDNFSYCNAMILRLKLSSQFTDKLSGYLNVTWAQKENVEYLENWDYTNGALNGVSPTFFKLDEKNDVDDGLGWEVRAKLTYELQEYVQVGLDLCYYAPGDYYESLIETGFEKGYDTGYDLEDTYAARWIVKVCW